MIVSLLLKILERYSLCENGVIMQFVSHKNGSFWADEVFDDAVLVTPIDKDGNPNNYRSKYFRCSQLKDWQKRDALRQLIKDHNIKTADKRFGIAVYVEGNYCTIQ